MAYMGYRSNDAVLQSQRDYSACALDTGLNGSDFACGGSATSYPGLFSDFANFGYGIDKTTGLARDFDDTTDLYNYGPLNYFQRPDERYSLGAFGHYEVSPAFDVYSEIMVTDYRTVAQIAPSGTFFETETINCGNPLLNGLANGAVGGGAFSVEQLDTMGCNQAAIDADTVVPMFIGRRNVEGGGRQDDLHYESYRMVGGVRGEIAPGWDYDLSLVYSKVQLSEIYKNDLSISRMTKALDVVDADAGAGVDPQCRSAVAGTDPDCVPFNVFELDGVTPEALAYLSIPLIQTGSTTQREGTFVLNADLGTFGVVSPWAETPVQAVLGVDWRRDELESAVDTAFATGDGAGQGGPTIAFPSAAVDLTEYFGEVEAFILEDKPWAKHPTATASMITASRQTRMALVVTGRP
jgi:hypothetical protein